MNRRRQLLSLSATCLSATLSGRVSAQSSAFPNKPITLIAPHLFPSTGYSLDPFAPVSHLASVDLIICAHPSVKANNLKEFIALAKATPGKYNYATAGNGSANHLAGEMLKTMAGIFLTHIPYRGGGPAIMATIGGEVEIVVAFPPRSNPTH